MKILIALAGLSLLSGCTTFKMVAETSQTAVTEVQDEHTPEEWAAFYNVLSTVAGKGAEVARTKTGKNVFIQLSETAADRAEYWESK